MGAKRVDRGQVPGFGPSDGELDRTNTRLRECARVGGLRAFENEGEIILRDIFAGDVAAWESRSPAKMNSIRRLAKRPGAPYQKDGLTKRIGVHVALQRLEFVWKCEQITASHVVEVLRLPHEERVRMLSLVQAEGWSVRRLHEQVVQHRRERGERRGRRVSPRVRKAVAQLRKATSRLARVPALLQHAAHVDERSQAELRELSQELATLQRRIDEVVRGLAPRATLAERKAIAELARHVPRAAAG
jgi:hypothetical protein